MNNGHGRNAAKDNTILCLIDFSEASQRALRWATALAPTLKARLTILYSYRLLQSKTEVLNIKKQAEVDALQKFLKWESEILSNNQVEYEFRSEVGFMPDRVEDYLKNNSVILLVIHKPMIHESKEVLQQLVDHLQVPLTIVP